MLKKDRHAAIRERASEAIRNMYHNATPAWFDAGDREREAQSWFEDAAQFEIEYIASGGAYGGNESQYRKTLEAPCNAGRYKSEAARRRYVAKGLREMREDRARNAWERISEYGKLYQWGRGGRTLAPDGLIKQGGGSSFWPDEDWPTDRSIADCVELIRIVESFNAYVEAWNKGVPDMWKEYRAEEFDGANVADVAELSDT